MKKKEKIKEYRKMTAEDVQGLLAMRRRGGKVPAKKGKGSYNRKAFKKGERINNEYYLHQRKGDRL